MIIIPSVSKTGITVDSVSIVGLDKSMAVKAHLDRYTGSYTDAQKAIIARAYSDFRAAGLHTKLDSFAFVAGNSADSLMNWIVGGPVATNSGMLLTANQGWQGDGSAKYINTGFNPSSGGPWNYTLDSASLSVFAAQTPSLTNAYAMGSVSGSLRAAIIPDGVSNNSSARLNGASTASVVNDGYARGSITVNRLSSVGFRLVDDGVLMGTPANVSDSMPTSNITVGGNITGSPSYFTGRIGGWAIGGSLTRQQEIVLAGVMNWLARVWAVA